MNLMSTTRNIPARSFKSGAFFKSEISRIMLAPKSNISGSDFQRRVSHA